MLDDVLLAQFAWQRLTTASSEMAAVIWSKFKEAMAETAVTKFQNMLENKKEDEFKQELANALKYNSGLARELENLRQQTQQGNHISVQIGDVIGGGNVIGNNININQR